MSGGRHEQRTADKHPLSHSADPTAEYSGSVACAVVVTFNPDGGFPERLNELSTRFQRVLVVDNSDRRKSREFVADQCLSTSIELIQNEQNLGVATALNLALRWADSMGANWLLTLDQDSSISSQLIDVYENIFASLSDPDRVGCIGIYLGHRAARLRHAELLFDDVSEVITSGCLLNVGAAQQVGGYWDGLFIDGVDRELCLRLKHAGFRVIATSQDVLIHHIGTGRYVTILGRRLYLNDHLPVRRYYMARNLIWISRRHRRHINWYHLLRENVVSPLMERNASAKIFAGFRGIFDGLLKPLPHFDASRPARDGPTARTKD